MKLSYLERANYCKNTLAKELFQLMQHKQSNLALSADVKSCAELLQLAETIGPKICLLKTHIDILSDFTPSFTKHLENIAKQQQFLLFEDRKFADIGNTVKLQYTAGIYHIADWAHMINAHTLPGPGVIQGLAEAGLAKNRGLLLLAEMSSSANLFTPEYTQKTLAMAKQHEEFVIGFITQKKLSPEPQWIYMTPGIQFNESHDTLGQQYITPEKAIIENGNDIIIVGRGILQATDRIAVAEKYRLAGWNAYENTLI